MKKITLIAITTIFAVLLFGISSFAANNIASDAVNGVRNVVGGTENIVGGAIGGMTNGIRNGMSAIGNTFDNTTDTMDNDGAMSTNNNNNGGYDATRTTTRMAGTNATNNNFLGMSDTAWGWFILATVGIITIALVWYYGKQHETRYNQDDNY